MDFRGKTTRSDQAINEKRAKKTQLGEENAEDVERWMNRDDRDRYGTHSDCGGGESIEIRKKQVKRKRLIKCVKAHNEWLQ